jgi:hypothetical protein
MSAQEKLIRLQSNDNNEIRVGEWGTFQRSSSRPPNLMAWLFFGAVVFFSSLSYSP